MKKPFFSPDSGGSSGQDNSCFLLQEDGSYLLQEDGYKLLLDDPTCVADNDIPIIYDPAVTKISQSAYLYAQAVGSDGATNNGNDGTAKGIHLRWTFLRDLADRHLPKGNLTDNPVYATTQGFNKANDFIYLFRTPYVNPTLLTIDSSFIPASITITSTATQVSWECAITGQTAILSLTFKNKASYQAAQAQITPSAATFWSFLQAYNQYFEIGFKDRLMFAGDFAFTNLTGGSNALLLLEAIGSEGILAGSAGNTLVAERLDCRTQAVQPSGSGSQKIFNENTRYFRVQVRNGSLTRIQLETYDDFINSRTESSWTQIGRFSLNLEDAEVFDQLENPALYPIDNSWPQFNEGMRVKVQNYQDRWSATEGLKKGVEDYLTLSKVAGNEKAVTNLGPGPNNSGELADFPVSYLDLLNLVSLDYHVARMLGLGCIDNIEADPNAATGKFVYLMAYQTRGDLVNLSTTDLVTHLTMTLPTGKTDYRLPPQPILRSVTYGFEDKTNTEGLVDANGYSKFEAIRYINIGRNQYDYEMHENDVFFQTDTLFSRSQLTRAIFYGIEYKIKGANAYVQPEITSYSPDGTIDSGAYKVYSTNGEVAEPNLVPDDFPGLYIHQERAAGFHTYAGYGVNWFSRVSAISNAVDTDETEFVQSALLSPVPPSDVHVQYVQEEDPLIFTSSEDQAKLLERTGQNLTDLSFVRVTFNWCHVQNIAYQKANQINFYFRDQTPLEIRGIIQTIWSVPGDPKLARVETQGYIPLDGEPIQAITPADYTKFIGSVLATPEDDQFEITDVQSGATGPTLIICKIKQVDTVETSTTPGQYVADIKYRAPSPGTKFLAVENLSEKNKWQKLGKSVEIINFSPLYTDLIDGELRTVGGINAQATITEQSEVDLPGVYSIAFNNYSLAVHPDGDVRWYKGIARIELAGNATSKKVLDVLKIETLSPLKIWVYDSDTVAPIRTGSNVSVNFHPGYRIYLYPEVAPSKFNQGTIMPSGSQLTKSTFIGVQSEDNTNSRQSNVSTPAVLLARAIEKLEAPTGSADFERAFLFASKPDFYGKSSFSFDVQISTSGGRSPFGLLFLRANEQTVLEALYKTETILSIENSLRQLSNDPSLTHIRFKELVNVEYDETASTNNIIVFNTHDGYQFPEPDKVGLWAIGDPLADKVKKCKAAVETVFVPVTEQPPLYNFLKAGFQTENKKPVITKSSGELLAYDDPAFDPFPMVKKFTEENQTYVRITDYTLDSASRNTYFYYAREINSKLQFSERTPILGPVQLINTYPPEAPVIKSYVTQLENPVLGLPVAVRFEIEPYLSSENVTEVRIYRALANGDTDTVRRMTLAATPTLEEDMLDDFSDLTFPPFGSSMYYRLVAVRTVTYQQKEGNEVKTIEEKIPSQASVVIVASVVDVNNPPAPVISASFTSIGSTLPPDSSGDPDSPPPGEGADLDTTLPERYEDVVLEWGETCYKGTYYLYKMNGRGNWVKIYQTTTHPDTFSVNLVDTSLQSNILDKQDDEGNLIYHRFKVRVENSSGLFNLEEQELTI